MNLLDLLKIGASHSFGSKTRVGFDKQQRVFRAERNGRKMSVSYNSDANSTRGGGVVSTAKL